VLATDLDGTFLGGSEADRRTLYDWIEANRDEVGLIFVTGPRSGFHPTSAARRACPGPITWWAMSAPPSPRSVEGDWSTGRPSRALEAEIAARWGDAGARVRAALDGAPGLTLQPTAVPPPRQLRLRPRAFDRPALDIVAAGPRRLISADRYFDVLPKGVSKGPSLRACSTHLASRERPACSPRATRSTTSRCWRAACPPSPSAAPSPRCSRASPTRSTCTAPRPSAPAASSKRSPPWASPRRPLSPRASRNEQE
jgi:hypothetical protein